ncbi:hypothetical protein Vafri_2972 [Volvox africanus]|uniref:Vacuolar protein sorting-associated protein 62 n=1 Tax=Volvox africanus TaxID=51714 RepID=A0A8J4ASL8_9CHLO|nr:hypothetical protein Vafri_2972 [Volvox africanus]
MPACNDAAATIPALSDEILAVYCPVLYLHHDDAYMPISVEWFIERAQLNYYPEGVTGAAEVHGLDDVPGGVIRLIPTGEVTQQKLLEAQTICPNPCNLSLTVGSEHYGGISSGELAEVPIYAHVKLVVDDNSLPEAYEINYVTFYAFNGHYNLPANVPLFRTGHHVGDWEHLTVRLDAASLELQGVWYNAHRNIEGEWCPAEAVPRTPCGRILGYVAINGHGVYPHCGTIHRLFFVANDRTSRRGPVWNPARLVRLCGLDHGSGCAVVQSRGCSLPSTSAYRSCSPPGDTSCLAGARGSGVIGDNARSDAGRRLDSDGPPRTEQTGDAASPAPPASSYELRSSAAEVEAREDAEPSAVLCGPCSPVTTAAARFGVTQAGSGGQVRRTEQAAAEVIEASSGGDAGTERATEMLPGVVLAAMLQGAPAASAQAAASSEVDQTSLGPDSDTSGGGRRRQLKETGTQFPLPVVVHDTSPWQRYRGYWGSVISATQQGWFLGAEPPVSRGCLRRLFMPFARGVERLEPAKPAAASTPSALRMLMAKMLR